MKALLTVILVMTSGLVMGETTFEHGTEYSVTNVSGQVHVYCGTQNSFQVCSGYQSEPGSYTRLVSGANANRYQITAIHADGSSVSKKGRFNAGRGQSDEINLFVRSVLQRPLLKIGQNLVRYELTKGGDTVEQGEFVVHVAAAPDIVCRTGTIWMNPSSCSSQALVCDEYFARFCF